MKHYLARLDLMGIVALAAALGASGPAHATITVLDQYYLGEADGPGAVDGSVPVITTDSIGSLDLAAQTNTRPSVISTYTSNVSAAATAHTGSNLAIQFSNANGHAGATDTLYSAPARATAATDNFGIEGWFKVTENHAPGIVAFNGNAFSNGFGLMVNQVGFSGTFSYQALYGGVSYLDSRVPVTLDSWVYMAMVRDSGVTSLYVNNTTPITPSNPFTLLPNPSVTPLAADAGFGIGGTALAGNPLVFSGGIDEVRVFTFAPGQFSTNDLLISQTPAPPPPPPLIVTLWNTNASGTFSDSPNWDNGVPDASKTPVFRRGASVAYTVTVSDSHQDVSDRLLVGSNRVTFAPGVEIFKTYTVENTTTAEDGRGIIIGELTADVAVVNTSLPSFSGAAATLGDAPRSRGTLNLTGGTFNVTGSDASNIEFIVGRKGAGILNVTGGATANVTADTALGENTGATGTATVSGAGSTWTNGGDLHVGYSGHGTLNVTSGGQVSNANGYVGSETGSVGTAIVDGTGSTWTSSEFLYVGYASAGTLNLTGGGQVVSTTGYIGNNAGVKGTASVAGAGSKWTNSGELNVGRNGNGTLNLTSGGQASNVTGFIGLQSGSTGLANIDGANSNWTNSSNLYVGYAGAGTLSLTNGGQVSSTNGFIGTQPGSAGAATVDGVNSTWTNSGDLYVGDLVNGTLNVTRGGQVSNVDGYIGYSSNSTSSATVAGANSKWTNNGNLYVGNAGSGTLNVTAGGRVNNGNAYIGFGSGPTSTAVVSGAGSILGNGNMYVGYSGHGTLSNSNGGEVSSAVMFDIGELSGSTGLVDVDGSSMTFGAAGLLYVGNHGMGTLNLTNGAGVGGGGRATLGGYAGSVGMVTVAGATWDNNGDLFVGNGGHGTLSLVSGSHVSNRYDENLGVGGTIAASSGSIGVVNVDGAGSEWDCGGTLLVGLAGIGALNITSGGLVFNGFYGPVLPKVRADGGAEIGGGEFDNATEGVGMATIDGAGSAWYIRGDLSVGYRGHGTLSITSGGQVSSTPNGSFGNQGNGYIGNQAGSIGAVTVDGANSKLTSGNLFVGYAGTGTLTVSNGGTVQAMTVIVGSLGEIHGNGFITGNVQNGGLVSPGNSPGVLTITGNYTQTTAGKLLIELAGTTLGTQYDQLHVSGTVTLGGALQVSLLSGFAPSSGDSFDLLTTFSGITGTFANPQLPMLAGGLVWNLSYGPNDVILSVGGALGDYNHDGVVDAADYVVWRKGLGTTYTQNDYNVWRANFGQTAPGAGSGAGVSANAAVPEPSTLVLLMFAAASWCLGRGRAA